MSILLITMASGWKLSYEDIGIFDDNSEIYLPLCMFVFTIHTVLVALLFVDMDASHKYHDFSGIQGWCLVVLKTLLFAYFFYCQHATKKECKKMEQKAYLTSLLTLGAAYMLAVPFCVVLTFVFEPWERQYIYTLSTELIMFGANATMFYLLSSKRSTYRKSSTDDATLPGAE